MSSSSAGSFTWKVSVDPVVQSFKDTESELKKLASSFETIMSTIGASASRQFDVFLTGMAQDVNKTWEATEKAFGDYTKSALKDSVVAAFQGEMDQVEDIWGKAWDGMAAKVEGLWDKLPDMAINRAMSGAENMFKDLVFKPVSDWFTSLLPTELLNFFGKGTTGAAGGGLVGTLKSAAAGFAGYLGWDSLATMLGGNSMKGLTAGIEHAFYGVNAASEAATTTAAASSQTGSLASLGAMFASPGGAMAMAALPGMVGMMLSQMGFLMDGPMTPEEAQANWEGNLGYMEKMTEQMRALGLDFDELQQGIDEGSFALFGQSAQEAADALEHLHTVAGYSQEQIDALVASLDPLTQEFLASGQAANDLEGQVGGLVQEMNASINSYAMTSDAVNLYNGRIDALAQRLGLSGEAARAFREEVWNLAEGFSNGGEEAEQFDRALNDFIGNTLGGLTEGAQDGAAAINGLIDSMGQAQGLGEGLVGIGSLGGGGSSGGSGGSSGSGASGDVTLGVMHGGGYVMGWPKAHAGALISSLASDEVPLIARRGEYVVRAEAVTPATLPALKALNLGAVGSSAAAPVVNLHVEIHGNMLGSRDNLEDLARLLEGKLRDLDRARWKA